MGVLQWLMPWDLSMTIIAATSAAALLFLKGCRRTPRSIGQKAAFGTGLFLMYAATQTQADYYAEHEFFAHQLQNAVLHHWGPFLIAMAYPRRMFFAGFPQLITKWVRRVSYWRPIQILHSLLFHPAALVVSFVGLIIFWLIPSVHWIMMLDWRIYRLMNWSMALNGLIFWVSVLGPNAGYSSGCRIAMMLTVVPPQILIGALLFFAPQELYPIYTLCGRAFSTFSSIADQQTGGLILWTQGAMMSIAGILILIWRELRQPE